MIGGDISNVVCKHFVINADLLIEVKKSWIGFKKFIPYPDAIDILHYIFMDDLGAFIVINPHAPYTEEKVRKILDNIRAPYSAIIQLDEGGEVLERLLKLPFVINYFYKEPSVHKPFSSISKHVRVNNLTEIFRRGVIYEAGY